MNIVITWDRAWWKTRWSDTSEAEAMLVNFETQLQEFFNSYPSHSYTLTDNSTYDDKIVFNPAEGIDNDFNELMKSEFGNKLLKVFSRNRILL